MRSRSTDFEVHRNWMAITHRLPMAEWYHEVRAPIHDPLMQATSQWTLDYPPLFAWMEYVLAMVAERVDASMLHIRAEDWTTPTDACIRFHRFSVIVTELISYSSAVHWYGIAIVR